MPLRPSKEYASIVILGSFNPAIIQPSWLALRDLIPRSAADGAKVELISPQLSQFSVTGIKLTVIQERFAAEAEEVQDQVRMRDLVLGVFTALAETPLTRMGFNWTFEFTLSSQEKWHAVGDQLAPKKAWTDLIPGRPGLKTLIIMGVRENDAPPGTVNVRVEPRPRNGVFLEVNHEFVLPQEKPPSSSEYFIDLIKRLWDQTHSNTTSLVQELLSRAGGD